MADPAKRHPRDDGGEWFVDTTCIDCDVARQVAPGLIAEDADGLSYFTREPEEDAEVLLAWRAVLACPTGSVGAPKGAKPPDEAFPFEVAPGVLLTGYNARSTFGSNAYYLPPTGGDGPRDTVPRDSDAAVGAHRPGILVDAPRYVPRLADRLDALGGVDHVLLTHRDDVGDYAKYAARWGARVWIHEADRSAAPDATDVFTDEVEVAPGVRALPTPGHTRGSACYLVEGYGGRLFTGDSLYWSRELDDLNAFRGATWYSWDAQTESLARLARHARFAWVLPGHGGRGHAAPEMMRERLERLVERMREGAVREAW